MKLKDITDENIRNLVDEFYLRVRRDKELGPIFLEAIGNNDEAWKIHLQNMYNFWSSVMLGSDFYRGNPFQKHRMLPPFDIELFDNWLALFAECTEELFIQEIAEQFIAKSQRIANSLKMGLYFTPKNRRYEQKDVT